MSRRPVTLPEEPLDGVGDLARALGGEETSFIGAVLALTAKADPGNRERLRRAFPREVTAWELWMAARPTPTSQDLLDLLAAAEPWIRLLRDPFARLAGFELQPSSAGGVFAVCRRHADKVHVLGINSFEERPILADLAHACAEHEAEQHGEPLCRCGFYAQWMGIELRRVAGDAGTDPACPEHGDVAQAFKDAERLRTDVARLARQLGAPIGVDTEVPAEEVVRQACIVVNAARHLLDFANERADADGVLDAVDSAAVAQAADALSAFRPARSADNAS